MADLSRIRTLGFFAPTGTGKTAACEALLHAFGATTRLGRIAEGNTVMDFEPEEIKRQVSVSAAVAHGSWKGHSFYIVDTPGNDNFIGDAYAVARVVDGAVFVIALGDTMRYQYKRLWKLLADHSVPRVVLLNKVDHEAAKFDFEGIRSGLGVQGLVLLHLPIVESGKAVGFVDVLKDKAFSLPFHSSDGKADLREIPVPDSMKTDAQAVREKAIEVIAETDDAMLEKYLAGEALSEAELTAALKKGVHSSRLFPVLIGSTVGVPGITPLAEALIEYLPSPSDRPPMKFAKPEGGGEVERRGDPSAPIAAFVFKTVADPHIGQLSYFRVFSGTLKADSSIINVGKKEKERLAQLLRLTGKVSAPVQEVGPGEIAVVAKLKSTSTGDTLADPKDPVLIPPIEFPKPVLSYAVSPKAKGDEEKVSMALHKLTDEDPTATLRREQQTKEMILSGLGDVHIEVLLEKMKRKFGVEVNRTTPTIPYKETVRKKVQADGKYVRQSGGRGQYGWCWLEVEPLPRGTGYEFVDKIFGGAIPRNFIPSVEKGVHEALETGPLAGFPVVDVRVTLFDGKYHDVDSSDMAFRIAGSMGFKKAAEQAGPVMLEPVVTLEVRVPEDYVGSVIADLNSRRAKVQGMDAVDHDRVIKAVVPMPEVMAYSAALTSITGGAGEFSFDFSHYEEVPNHLTQKLIDSRKKGQGASSS